MRKFAFVIPVVLLAAGATGCATKKFVRGEVGTVNGKVEGLTTQVEETQERTKKNEARIGEVDTKADAAGKSAQEARQAIALGELEQMLADPPAHQWKRLTNADLGRPGCTTYHVRPRAGLLGMLMGWWVVKISGGCP